MTDADKRAINKKIQHELARLRQDIECLTELTDPAALEGLDEVARMDAIVSKSVHESALKTAKNRVAALEYSMKRLAEDPEFGYCVDCGDEIPLQRLLSMPEASRCVNCAE